MSRLSRSRAVIATGLTLGTATAGLLFAPAAFAADPPEIVDAQSTGTVDGPTSVVAGTKFTLKGTDCRYLTSGDTDIAPGVLLVTDSESDNPDDVVFDAEPDAAGAWTAELSFPADTPSGEHDVEVGCLKSYNGTTLVRTENYETFTLTVTAPAAPVAQTAADTSGKAAAPAAQASASAPASASADFKPGAKANTPGVANSTTAKTTGNVAAPGQKVVKVLKGFQPFEKVTLVLHSTPVELGTFTADANGVVTAEFTLPAGTPLGQHTLAYDGDQGTHFEDTLTLTADGKALAYTGASIGLPLVGGSVLLAAGAGALVLGRRRRTAGAVQA